jgi:hypothetical protein
MKLRVDTVDVVRIAKQEGWMAENKNDKIYRQAVMADRQGSIVADNSKNKNFLYGRSGTTTSLVINVSGTDCGCCVPCYRYTWTRSRSTLN